MKLKKIPRKKELKINKYKANKKSEQIQTNKENSRR